MDPLRLTTIPDLQNVARESVAEYAIGASQFNRIVCDLARGGILNVDVKVNMWILPLNIRDNAGQRDALVAVEFRGKRMVSECRNCNRKQGEEKQRALVLLPSYESNLPFFAQ
jgi:hypothetical protein